MPRVTHILGPVDAPHRVTVTQLDSGQGHAECMGPGCGWVGGGVLLYLALAAAGEHIAGDFTPEQRRRLAAVVTAAHPAAYRDGAA